ncbi:uracil-DNA glycosylase family protein [Marinobacter sp.]|uniref:uracil-DNA glycosylase family protein n=1 Tax=Marinobacter sp. TaxID=50741 RepID=UPI003569E43E
MTDDLSRLPFDDLVRRVRACTICAGVLPHEPRPVIQISESARILVVGQAPGRRVHETGLPFNDPSGDRLRQWMGITRDTFYDEQKLAILPMGFCYPGTGKSGDLPPRPECAPAWRQILLDRLPDIGLTLVIGQYAHAWHLGGSGKSVTENVRRWREFGPDRVPLPHPSPRNNGWLRNNPWFEAEVVPALQARVRQALNDDGQTDIE